MALLQLPLLFVTKRDRDTNNVGPWPPGGVNTLQPYHKERLIRSGKGSTNVRASGRKETPKMKLGPAGSHQRPIEGAIFRKGGKDELGKGTY